MLFIDHSPFPCVWSQLGLGWAGLGWAALGRGNHSNESSESNPRLRGDKRGIRLTLLIYLIVITDYGTLNGIVNTALARVS